jgi:hypothetical protein
MNALSMISRNDSGFVTPEIWVGSKQRSFQGGEL